jgi:glycine/D-amino acid oxidase-like deaminating enzyme
MLIMENSSSWSDVSMPKFSSARGRLSAEAVVIGGGITGITAAYLLAKAGIDVVVLERTELGAGATAYTTACITQSLDTDTEDLVSTYGKKTTTDILSAHAAAIKAIEDIIAVENIDCAFTRCSNYLYTTSEKGLISLENEAKALTELGFSAHLHSGAEDRMMLGFSTPSYLEIPHQGKFHPRKYLRGLTDAASAAGVRIFTESEVLTISGGTPVLTTTPTAEVSGSNVIVATYTPFEKPLALHFKKAVYTTYVLEVRIPCGSIREGIYEDTEVPYHYLRVDTKEDGNTDRLIFGGEDHRSDIPVDPKKSFEALETCLKNLLPEVKYTITRRWKGPIAEPVDGLAYIGPLQGNDHVLYATGFSGNGMTYSMIAAQIFRDTILRQENPWQKIYSADRSPGLKSLLQKGVDYTEEFIGGAVKNTFRKKG